MIDVHCLKHGTQDRSATLSVMVEQLKNESDVNLFLLPGVNGNIGVGRFKGFSLGKSEFVSFIDDDDALIDPTIFATLEEYLKANTHIDVIGSLETTEDLPLVQPSPRFSRLYAGAAMQLHHVVVIRRSALKKHINVLLDFPVLAEKALYMSMEMAGCQFALYSKIAYRWNRNSDIGHRSMLIKRPLRWKGLLERYEQYRHDSI